MTSDTRRWKPVLIVLFIMTILVIFVAGCMEQQSPPPVSPETTAAPVMEFTESDDGKTVSMQVGSEFRVSLDGNPTTGYSWNATLSEGLELLDSNFTTAEQPPGMVGVGGIFFWDVRASGKGTQEFSAIYMRPWENVTGEEDTFSMTFIVE